MTKEFKMVGLSKKRSVTCEHKNDFFWATAYMTQTKFDALFTYIKNGWTGRERVVLEYEKETSDGFPIEAKAIDFILP